MPPRHYLKIPASIREWFPGGAPTKWREEIFDDVTSGGTALVVERLPPNIQGSRAALFGERFYCEVGRDRDRPDTLFLMRIEPAERRLPRAVPVSFDRQIAMWPGGDPILLHPVDDLFGTAARQTDDQATTVGQGELEPSPLLLTLLAQMRAEVRRQFSPIVAVQEPEAAKEFLQVFRRVWSRFRLDRYVETTARQESLLKGIVTPHILNRRERDEFSGLFGIRLLNGVALDSAGDVDRFGEFLSALVEAPILPATRASLWGGMLAGLPLQELRNDLFESATALRALARRTDDVGNGWSAALIPRLAFAAEQNGDQSLAELLTGDPTSILSALAEWSEQRQREMLARTETVLSQEKLPSAEDLAPVASNQKLSAVERWVLSLRLQGIPDPTSRQAAIAKLAEDVSAIPATLESMDAIRSLRSAARDIEASIGMLLRDLPEPQQLEADLLEAQSAYVRGAEQLGTKVDKLLEEATVTPEDLIEIADLLARRDLLRQVPDWLWVLEEDIGETTLAAEADAIGLATRLVRPETRRRVRMLVEMVDQLGESSALAWLPPLPQGAAPSEHIRTWFKEVREFVAALPDEVRPWLKAGIASREDVQGLTLLRESLAPESFQRLEARAREIADPAARSREIELFCRAVNFYRRNYVDPRTVPYEGVQSWVDDQRKLSPETSDDTVAARNILLEHNWTDHGGSTSSGSIEEQSQFYQARRIATLVFVRPDAGVDYGVVSAPMVIQTDSPQALDLRIDWQVKGDARLGWLRDWPNPEPERLAIPLYRWRQQPDGNYHYAFEARFPIRRPRADKARLEVVATLFDQKTGSPLGSPKPLKWESIALEFSPPAVQWGDAVVPEHVKDHPIGPQRRADAILQRLAAGASVAVIAPRRFGKSTLVEYLVEAGKGAGVAIPPATVCTDARYSGSGVLDYERLWGDVSDRLHALLGTGLPRDMVGEWPDENAFDHVKRAAKSKGYKSVALLFDEAQLMFPVGRGGEFGGELKRLLERYWARSDSERVPLVIGMIGLASLQERGGADLMGLLNPITRDVMTEEELRPLIRQTTSRMQTTRGARARLAQKAGNLLILRAMLERLAAHISSNERSWANHDDVLVVEEALKRDLEAGREETVASYVRDVLNAGERVHTWDPIPSFPVAVALAKTRMHGQTLDEARDRSADLLNQWCRQYQSDASTIPVYDATLVDEHMNQLRERRAITQTGFGSDFLAAWLAGIAQRGAFDESFRQALMRGAHRRVKFPLESVDPVVTGGEATIFRDARSGLAYRVKVLATGDDEIRFRESIGMFDALRNVIRRREAGSDYLFELMEMGLSARNPREAIQVYRWINGEDLTHYKESLSADLVTDLGLKLSRGLRLLHRYSVLHRDICPRNIVLDRESDPEFIRPVLIDFGFARLASMPMRTELTGDHVAPETRGSHPVWSRAADVFGLSWTLAWLLKGRGKETAGIRGLLKSGTAERADERPTADELVTHFERLELEAHLDEKRDEHWREIEHAVADDRQSPWFREVLRNARSLLVPMRMGFHADPVDQFAAIAYFLNRVSEEEPVRKSSLKDIRMPRDARHVDGMKILWALRNYHAHGHALLFAETKNLVEAFRLMSPLDRRGLVNECVEVLEGRCHLEHLSELVQLLLPAEKPEVV